MKNFGKTAAIAFAAAFALGFLAGAEAAPAKKQVRKASVTQKVAQKRAKKAAKSAKSTKVGEGLRRKKNHEFDGMTLDGLNNGRYDSITSLSEGGDRGNSRLYTLPANFSYRAADEKSEMRYRQ